MLLKKQHTKKLILALIKNLNSEITALTAQQETEINEAIASSHVTNNGTILSFTDIGGIKNATLSLVLGGVFVIIRDTTSYDECARSKGKSTVQEVYDSECREVTVDSQIDTVKDTIVSLFDSASRSRNQDSSSSLPGALSNSISAPTLKTGLSVLFFGTESRSTKNAALTRTETAYHEAKYDVARRNLQELLTTAPSTHNNYVYFLISLIKLKSGQLFDKCGFTITTFKMSQLHADFKEKIIAAVKDNYNEIDNTFAIICAFLRETSYQEDSFFVDLYNTSQYFINAKKPELADKIYHIFLSLKAPFYAQFSTTEQICLMNIYVNLAERNYADSHLAMALDYFDQFNFEYIKRNSEYDVTPLTIKAFNLRAEIAIDNKDYETAERFLSRVKKMAKMNTRMNANLAAILFHKGNIENAFTQLQDTMPRCSNDDRKPFLLLTNVCVAMLSASGDRIDDCVKAINNMSNLQQCSMFDALLDVVLSKLVIKAYYDANNLVQLILLAAQKNGLFF